MHTRPTDQQEQTRGNTGRVRAPIASSSLGTLTPSGATWARRRAGVWGQSLQPEPPESGSIRLRRSAHEWHAARPKAGFLKARPNGESERSERTSEGESRPIVLGHVAVPVRRLAVEVVAAERVDERVRAVVPL